ncbi:MAG: glycosyltransferase [Patescibacteria group bacterium]
MKIWAHTLVKNEERFIWYSVLSVISHVDKVLIWDTGSTDKTLRIDGKIKELYPSRVELKEVGEVDIDEFTKIRQQMLGRTKSDWLIVVDGDEIWWEESIKKVVQVVRGSSSRAGKRIESVVVPMYNLVGDIYHYQEKVAGRYKLAGREGHYALRAINRKIPGLKSEKPHGTWGWTDKEGKMIQDRNSKKIRFVDAPYLHASFLKRSSSREKDDEVPKRRRKLKYEVGIPLQPDFYYPEVFFRPRPKIVPSPWDKMDKAFYLRALVQSPPKRVKRRLWKKGVGY